MKHDNGMLERHFNGLCAFPNETQRFYTFKDPRYCALFKAHKSVPKGPYQSAVQVGAMEDVYTLYIYDSHNYGGSAAFKITKDGILGLNGVKEQVEEQKLLIAQLLADIANQVIHGRF